jgi:hypothetical protein
MLENADCFWRPTKYAISNICLSSAGICVLEGLPSNKDTWKKVIIGVESRYIGGSYDLEVPRSSVSP